MKTGSQKRIDHQIGESRRNPGLFHAARLRDFKTLDPHAQNRFQMNQRIALNHRPIHCKKQFYPHPAVMQPAGRHVTISAIIAATAHNKDDFSTGLAENVHRFFRHRASGVFHQRHTRQSEPFDGGLVYLAHFVSCCDFHSTSPLQSNTWAAAYSCACDRETWIRVTSIFRDNWPK